MWHGRTCAGNGRSKCCRRHGRAEAVATLFEGARKLLYVTLYTGVTGVTDAIVIQAQGWASQTCSSRVDS